MVCISSVYLLLMFHNSQVYKSIQKVGCMLTRELQSQHPKSHNIVIILPMNLHTYSFDISIINMVNNEIAQMFYM